MLFAMLVLVLPTILIFGGIAVWALRGTGRDNDDVKAAVRRGWGRSSWMN